MIAMSRKSAWIGCSEEKKKTETGEQYKQKRGDKERQELRPMCRERYTRRDQCEGFRGRKDTTPRQCSGEARQGIISKSVHLNLNT
jgi:hypothetical protein